MKYENEKYPRIERVNSEREMRLCGHEMKIHREVSEGNYESKIRLASENTDSQTVSLSNLSRAKCKKAGG